MKVAIFAILAMAVTVLAVQTGSVQTPAEPIKVRGCLQGNGSDESPWMLRGVVLPAPPTAAPAAGPVPGGRGNGGARGGDAGGGRGDGRGQAPGAAGGGRGDGAGRGGDAGRGAPPPAAAPAPAQPPINLRLAGVDMTPWRNMFVEAEGTLGPTTAGLREFRVNSARSAYGDCR